MDSKDIPTVHEWRKGLVVPPIRKIRCVVKHIYNHGNRVYTLTLSPEKEIPAFRPGQFLHLALDDYDPSGFWPDSRPFSIASSPINRSQLSISYSVIGKFTSRMEKELVEGNTVWIKLPYGDFVVDETKEVVLIAGGTGITAFSAYIEALKPESNQDVYLFYGARNEDLLIYKEMLSKVARSAPHFHLQYSLESAPQQASSNGFMPVIGKLDIDWIWQKIEKPMTAVYFLSGPPPMLSRFSNDLTSYGISSNQIRIDTWE